MIKVRSIGAAEVQIGRRRITRSTEVVLAVAVYLCVRAGDRIARDEVVEIFWPDTELTKGRHSLRQILYRLRQKGFVLDEDGGELYLDPARVDCDARDALREAWPESAEPSMIEDSGEFLPGFAREISVRFRGWLDATRSRIAAQYRSAALLQLAEARREGRWADMERWARLVLRADPLNETATMARAESEVMAGSKAVAMEILDQYVEELGDRSGQIALPATMLRKRISERRTEWGGRGGREIALVGRQEAMNQLTEMIESASAGNGGSLLVCGAPGVGKTRLCNEVRAFADLTGFRTLIVRVPTTATQQPMSTILSLTPLLLETRGAAGSSPVAMRLLRSAISPDRPSETTHSPTTTTTEELTWALSNVLQAISHEAKLFIHLDDLHNCDTQSLEIVRSLAPAAEALRVIWLATSRNSRPFPERMNESPSSFGRITLQPLTRADSITLARAYSSVGSQVQPDEYLEEIARISGGNPLFLRELTALSPAAFARRDTPASLRRLIRERLSSLSALELRLLRLIGLLGNHASIARLRILSGSTAVDLAASLEQLGHSGLVAVSVTGVLELHESWHSAIFEQFPPTARIALGIECADLLAAEAQPTDSLERAWRAATLYTECGERERACSLFESAADQLRDRRLMAEAAAAYQRARELASEAEHHTRLCVKLAHVMHAVRDFDAALEVCESALAQLPLNRGADASSEAYLRAMQVDGLWRSGRPYRTALERLAQLARAPELPAEACHFCALVGLRLLLHDGQSDLETKFLRAVEQSTERDGATVTGTLALLIYRTERCDETQVRDLERHLSQMPLSDLPPSVQCMSLRYRSTAMRWIGDLSQAVVLGLEALSCASSFGLPGELELTALYLAFMYMDQCDVTSARHWLETSQHAARGTSNDERVRAQLLAHARLSLQEGRYRECAALFAESGVDPLSDTVGKRGALTAATLAVASAQCGQYELASATIERCIPIAIREPPSLVLDYLAELVVWCLHELKRGDEGTAFGREYLSRRDLCPKRPLAPFHARLHRLLAAHDSPHNP